MTRKKKSRFKFETSEKEHFKVTISVQKVFFLHGCKTLKRFSLNFSILCIKLFFSKEVLLQRYFYILFILLKNTYIDNLYNKNTFFNQYTDNSIFTQIAMANGRKKFQGFFLQILPYFSETESKHLMIHKKPWRTLLIDKKWKNWELRTKLLHPRHF